MPLPENAREALVEQAVAFIGRADDDTVGRVRSGIAELLAARSDDELAALLARVAETGGYWGYHPPNAIARAVNHVLADAAFAPGSAIENPGALEAARSSSVTFIPNHLSFSDANLLECLIHQAGRDDVAGRLVVLAGPKVYSDFYRRFSSLCFGTVKTPQSQSRATGEAVMPRREVAQAAREVFAAVEARRALGEHPLIFVEGTRSRTGGMQRALPAASRYLEGDVTIVPVGITGSDQLVPLGEQRINVSKVVARLGSPVRAEDLRRACGTNRTLLMDVVGLLVARQLPEAYRGAYATTAADLGAARAALAAMPD